MEDGATHVIISWYQSSSWGRNRLFFIKKENYWAGQNICLDFYDCAYGNIQMNFLANPIFEISLTIQVCGRPCTWWKAGSWGCGFSSSPQHICTHSHPRDISSGCLIHKRLEWGVLEIILKVRDEAEPRIRVDVMLKSQFSTMQEPWVPGGAMDVSAPEISRYLGKGLGIHKMKNK